MRTASAVSFVIAMSGCFLSHELGDAGVLEDAAACAPTASVALGAPAVTTLPWCTLHVPAPLPRLELCWRPCMSIGLPAGCEEATLAPWILPRLPAAMEREGVAYFAMGTNDASAAFSTTAILGSDGSSLAAVQHGALSPPGPGESGLCGATVDALSRDSWAFTLLDERVEADRTELDRSGELHAGALSDIAGWSVPRTAAAPELATQAQGVTTASETVLLGDPLVDVVADGTLTHILRGHDGGRPTRVAAIVEGRVLWLEMTGAHRVVMQRRAPDIAETFIEGEGDGVAAFGVDGPAYVWAETDGSSVHVFSAPIVVAPTDLRPRRVDETITPGWTTVAGAIVDAAFGHAHVLLVVATVRRDGQELLVVDIGSGRVNELVLPERFEFIAGVFTSPHQLVLVVQGGLMVRIDLDSLPMFTP